MVLLFFILLGGFFAAAEIALVSLREGQVKRWPSGAGAGEKVAELDADPNRFLAAVQIGVTLAGFLSAAFGGAAFADDLAPVLRTGACRTARMPTRAPRTRPYWLASSASPWSSPTCRW